MTERENGFKTVWKRWWARERARLGHVRRTVAQIQLSGRGWEQGLQTGARLSLPGWPWPDLTSLGPSALSSTMRQ